MCCGNEWTHRLTMWLHHPHAMGFTGYKVLNKYGISSVCSEAYQVEVTPEQWERFQAAVNEG